MNYFKRLETIIIVVVILVLGLAYGALNEKNQAAKVEQNSSNTQSDASGTQEEGSPYQQIDTSNGVAYQGEEGRTALDILKSQHNVETQSFGGVGEYVKSINGVTPDSSHFWSFYVNGQQAQVGADTYITKSTDMVEWKLEEIK